MHQAKALSGMLQNSELLAGIELGDICPRVRHFKKNCRIPACIDRQTPAVGIVLAGKIQVYSNCMDGKTVNLSMLTAGDCFGISNLYSGEELTTVLYSGSNVSVAYISHVEFTELMRVHPVLMERYLAVCNKKIRFLTQKIEFLTLSSCRAKLAIYLLGNMNSQQIVLLKMSKAQLAQVLGISRASLYRELEQMEIQRWVTVQGKQVAILQPDALRALAQDT